MAKKISNSLKVTIIALVITVCIAFGGVLWAVLSRGNNTNLSAGQKTLISSLQSDEDHSSKLDAKELNLGSTSYDRVLKDFGEYCLVQVGEGKKLLSLRTGFEGVEVNLTFDDILSINGNLVLAAIGQKYQVYKITYKNSSSIVGEQQLDFAADYANFFGNIAIGYYTKLEITPQEIYNDHLRIYNISGSAPEIILEQTNVIGYDFSDVAIAFTNISLDNGLPKSFTKIYSQTQNGNLEFEKQLENDVSVSVEKTDFQVGDKYISFKGYHNIRITDNFIYDAYRRIVSPDKADYISGGNGIKITTKLYSRTNDKSIELLDGHYFDTFSEDQKGIALLVGEKYTADNQLDLENRIALLYDTNLDIVISYDYVKYGKPIGYKNGLIICDSGILTIIGAEEVSFSQRIEDRGIYALRLTPSEKIVLGIASGVVYAINLETGDVSKIADYSSRFVDGKMICKTQNADKTYTYYLYDLNGNLTEIKNIYVEGDFEYYTMLGTGYYFEKVNDRTVNIKNFAGATLFSNVSIESFEFSINDDKVLVANFNNGTKFMSIKSTFVGRVWLAESSSEETEETEETVMPVSYGSNELQDTSNVALATGNSSTTTAKKGTSMRTTNDKFVVCLNGTTFTVSSLNEQYEVSNCTVFTMKIEFQTVSGNNGLVSTKPSNKFDRVIIDADGNGYKTVEKNIKKYENKNNNNTISDDNTHYRVTVYYTIKTYTVTLNNSSGGKDTDGVTLKSTPTVPSPVTIVVAYGYQTEIKSTCTATGYTLIGWAETKNATAATVVVGGKYTVTKNVTLYAVWSRDTYKITFKDNFNSLTTYGNYAPSGSVTSPVTAKYGDTVTLPKQGLLKAYGYYQQGWYYGGVKSCGSSVTVTGNATYTASWKMVTYNITYSFAYIGKYKSYKKSSSSPVTTVERNYNLTNTLEYTSNYYCVSEETGKYHTFGASWQGYKDGSKTNWHIGYFYAMIDDAKNDFTSSKKSFYLYPTVSTATEMNALLSVDYSVIGTGNAANDMLFNSSGGYEQYSISSITCNGTALTNSTAAPGGTVTYAYGSNLEIKLNMKNGVEFIDATGGLYRNGSKSTQIFRAGSSNGWAKVTVNGNVVTLSFTGMQAKYISGDTLDGGNIKFSVKLKTYNISAGNNGTVEKPAMTIGSNTYNPTVFHYGRAFKITYSVSSGNVFDKLTFNSKDFETKLTYNGSRNDLSFSNLGTPTENGNVKTYTNSGYKFILTSKDDCSFTLVIEGNIQGNIDCSITTKVVENDLVINKHNDMYSSNDSGLTIDCGNRTVKSGETFTINLTPASGYVVSSVSFNYNEKESTNRVPGTGIVYDASSNTITISKMFFKLTITVNYHRTLKITLKSSTPIQGNSIYKLYGDDVIFVEDDQVKNDKKYVTIAYSSTSTVDASSVAAGGYAAVITILGNDDIKTFRLVPVSNEDRLYYLPNAKDKVSVNIDGSGGRTEVEIEKFIVNITVETYLGNGNGSDNPYDKEPDRDGGKYYTTNVIEYNYYHNKKVEKDTYRSFGTDCTIDGNVFKISAKDTADDLQGYLIERITIDDKEYNAVSGTATAAFFLAEYRKTNTRSFTAKIYYKPIEYTVKYYAGTFDISDDSGNTTSGTVDSTKHLFNVESTLSSSKFTRTNWTHIGWTNDSAVIESNSGKSGNGENVKFYRFGYKVKQLANTNGATVKLYAAWQVNKFDVEFDVNDFTKGNGSTTAKVPSTGNIDYLGNFVLPTVTREGYTFRGWYANVYKAADYDLKFGDGQAQAVAKLTLTDTDALRVDNNEKLTYTKYNSLVNAGAVSGSTIKLHAYWTANKFKVVYNYDAPTGCNSPIDSRYYVTGEFVQGTTSPASPYWVYTYDQESKLRYMPVTTDTYLYGYTFVGWSNERKGDKVYDNQADIKNSYGITDNNQVIELYTLWDANTYTVKYNANNPSSTSSVVDWLADSEMTFDQANVISYVNIGEVDGKTSIMGYKFLYWTTNNTDGTEIRIENQADLNSNTLFAQNKKYGELPGKVVKLTAHWEANTITIVYEEGKPDDCRSEMKDFAHSASYKYDQDFKLQKMLYKGAQEGSYTYTHLDGYTFKEWKCSDTDCGSYDTTGAYQHTSNIHTEEQNIKNLHGKIKSETITLTAVWEKNTFVIKFHANVPSGASTKADARFFDKDTASSDPYHEETYTYDQAQVLAYMLVPESDSDTYLDGYTFLYWSTSESSKKFENKQNLYDLPESDRYGKLPGQKIDLYAVWKANKYYIIYNQNIIPLDTKFTLNSNTDRYPVFGEKYEYTFDTQFNLYEVKPYALKGYTFMGWTFTVVGSIKDTETFAGQHYTNKQSIHGKEDKARNIKYEDETHNYLAGRLPIGYDSATGGGEIVLYAIWGKQEFTIKFDMNTGSESDVRLKLPGYNLPDDDAAFSATPSDKKVWTDTAFGELPVVSSYGFDFTGWYFKPEYEDPGRTYRDTESAYNYLATTVLSNDIWNNLKYSDSQLLDDVYESGNKSFKLYAHWHIKSFNVKFENLADAENPNNITGTVTGDLYEYNYSENINEVGAGVNADNTMIFGNYAVIDLTPTIGHFVNRLHFYATDKVTGEIREYIHTIKWDHNTKKVSTDDAGSYDKKHFMEDIGYIYYDYLNDEDVNHIRIVIKFVKADIVIKGEEDIQTFEVGFKSKAGTEKDLFTTIVEYGNMVDERLFVFPYRNAYKFYQYRMKNKYAPVGTYSNDDDNYDVTDAKYIHKLIKNDAIITLEYNASRTQRVHFYLWNGSSYEERTGLSSQYILCNNGTKNPSNLDGTNYTLEEDLLVIKNRYDADTHFDYGTPIVIVKDGKEQTIYGFTYGGVSLILPTDNSNYWPVNTYLSRYIITGSAPAGNKYYSNNMNDDPKAEIVNESNYTQFDLAYMIQEEINVYAVYNKPSFKFLADGKVECYVPGYDNSEIYKHIRYVRITSSELDDLKNLLKEYGNLPAALDKYKNNNSGPIHIAYLVDKKNNTIYQVTINYDNNGTIENFF